MNKFILLVILPISLLAGCGSKQNVRGNSAQSIYQDVIEELVQDKEGFPWIFNSIDYDTVEEQLKEIQIRYTYSPYATLAELRTADLYFKQEEYTQASIEYEEFIKRHPSHNGVPYATFFLALSNYRLIKGADRSPKSAREAIKWFNIYLQEYPDSPLIPKTKRKIIKTMNVLSEREIHIGKFYAKRKNFKAAAARYKIILEEYPGTKKYDEALFLLGKSYIELEQNDLALSVLNRVVNEYPESKYSDDALSLASTIK